jgi:PAS domain S-box-containing protein
LANYFFLPPRFAFSASPQDLLAGSLFVTISTGITWLNVREQAARAEAEAERARLHTLFMQAPAIIAIHRGPEHVYEFSNPVNAQLLGGRELLGKTVRQAQPELEGQGFYELLDRVYQTGEPYSGQEAAATVGDPRNPRVGYFNFVYQPMLGPKGRPEGVLVFGFEVTEQVLARRRLEQAERRLTTITNNATQGLIMMDARQHCVFMNPAAEAITGFTLAELQGKPLHDFIHHTRPDGTHYPMEECPIDRALPTRNQEQGEDVFVRPDGTFYPVAFTASPIVEDGRAVGTVIELRDTSEDKRREQERARLLAELKRAVRVRDEFLSVASHELRTPLTPLGLKLGALERELERQPDSPFVQKVRDYVRTGRRQVKRLSDLVGDLLDVSRIAAGRFRLQWEDVDLAEAVREVASRFEAQAAQTGAALRVETPGAVPGRWDRLKLEQVLTNLLDNALKYGPGKPVHVRLEADPARVRVTVRDEGIGIAPESLARIFGRFERAVSERNYGGLGLGLYITRTIVEAMGGEIRVASEPGRGAAFTVELPRQPAERVDAVVPPPLSG